MRAMKDSGVEWIGEIPEEWTTAKFQYSAEVDYGFPADSDYFNSDEEGVPLIRIRDITSGEIATWYSGSYPRNLIVHEGDILIGMDGDFGLRTWHGPNALLNQRCCRIRGGTLDERYLFYCMEFPLKLINGLTVSTTVKHLLADDIATIELPVPFHEEQRRIGETLDGACTEIDAAIVTLEKQLSALERYRASVIHEAVTRGLDPSVPTKPSGVEWIGEIPIHWQAERVAYHCELESGHTPSRDHPEWWKDDECVIPWVTTGDIHRFRNGEITVIDDTEEHVSKVGLNHSSARILPAGTVALSRTASVGFSIIMGCDMASSQDFADWVPGHDVNSKYLLYVFRSMTMLFEQLKIGSTHKTIYMHVLKTLKMPIPPLDEQKRIADYLDSRIAAIDAILDTKRKQLDILKRRRQSLIYEYVTGKRRVGEGD